MKKSLILLPMAAVLLSLTGCKKDNEKSGPSGETVTLSATLGGGEKTEIYNETKMRWSAGDEVNINGTPYPAEFTVDYETAFFNVEADPDGYQAYYPASLYKGVMQGELPPTQTYHPENVNKLSNISPMYAEITPDTETTELQFHHICALVKLEVTGTGTVKQIVVLSSSNNLCGDFGIFEENGKFFAQIWDGEKSVTLDCSENGGVTLDSETPKTFYIALPQGTIENLTFKCSGDDGVWTSQPIATANLTAGKLYTKKLENVEMKCVFSVDGDGNTVEFAPGNLWANATGETPVFHFETNQWDYCVNDIHEDGWGALAGTWDPSHVSHFYWSKDAKEAVKEQFNSEQDMSVYGNFFTNDETFQVSGETVGAWRTLSKDEWNYLFGYNPVTYEQESTYGRPNAMNLCAWVKLKDVNVYGFVILPDGPDATARYVTTSALVSSCGAVFLPAAGYRNGTDVGGVDFGGNYWSSTFNEDGAYNMYFGPSYVGMSLDLTRCDGFPVRLVR